MTSTCHAGHDLTAENSVYIRPGGRRDCRECSNIRSRINKQARNNPCLCGCGGKPSQGVYMKGHQAPHSIAVAQQVLDGVLTRAEGAAVFDGRTYGLRGFERALKRGRVNSCGCGCGSPVANGKSFAIGHAPRLMSTIKDRVLRGEITLSDAMTFMPTDAMKSALERYFNERSAMLKERNRNPGLTVRSTVSPTKPKREAPKTVKPSDVMWAGSSKSGHTPTPVEDCGAPVGRQEYCSRPYPCSRHPDE